MLGAIAGVGASIYNYVNGVQGGLDRVNEHNKRQALSRRINAGTQAGNDLMTNNLDWTAAPQTQTPGTPGAVRHADYRYNYATEPDDMTDFNTMLKSWGGY